MEKPSSTKQSVRIQTSVLNGVEKKTLLWLAELTSGQCNDLKKQFLSNVNVDFLSIILDADDKVVGFGVAMPSLSKAMQKANGKLFPFGFVHVLKALKHNDTLDLLLMYRTFGAFSITLFTKEHGFTGNTFDNRIQFQI